MKKTLQVSCVQMHSALLIFMEAMHIWSWSPEMPG